MRFYYTFGSSPYYPFRGGYLTIEAPDLDSANRVFRVHYPDQNPGTLNCADVYSEAMWSQIKEGYDMGPLHAEYTYRGANPDQPPRGRARFYATVGNEGAMALTQELRRRTGIREGSRLAISLDENGDLHIHVQPIPGALFPWERGY